MHLLTLSVAILESDKSKEIYSCVYRQHRYDNLYSGYN